MVYVQNLSEGTLVQYSLDVVKIGIIGLGRVASIGHFPGYMEIPQLARVTALCDSDKHAMELFSERCRAKTYDDYAEVMKDSNVDAVDICLPHSMHAQVALAAINAGKHVLLEKPMATSIQEAERLVSASREKGVKLMIAENTRFVAAYELARKLVEQEKIGRVTLARTIIEGPGIPALSKAEAVPYSWRSKASEAAGAIFDAGVHSFYLLRWMIGEIKSVYAATTRLFEDLPAGADDNAVGTLKFVDGAVGGFAISFTTFCPWTERLELHGTKGVIIVDMLSERPIHVLSSEGRSEDPAKWWSRYGDVSWEEPFFRHSAAEWKTMSMKKEIEHFVSCIREDKQPLVSGEDGKRSIEVALKAYESATLGKEVYL
jgi:predicted dehydrogenase